MKNQNRRKRDINQVVPDYNQGLISLEKTLSILDMESVIDEIKQQQKILFDKKIRLVGEALEVWKKKNQKVKRK